MSATDRPEAVMGSIGRQGSGLAGARGHMCAFFHDREEEYRVLLPFIREGLELGEHAFHIVDPDREGDHRRRLISAGIDLAEAESRGQLEIRTWAGAHLHGGRFDQDRMLALAGMVIEQARRRGFPRSRFVTHMAWALGRGTTLEELTEYEARANHAVPVDGDPVICVYALSQWGGQALVDVMRTHPRVILGGLLHENPFFVAPEEFLREVRTRLRPAAS